MKNMQKNMQKNNEVGSKSKTEKSPDVYSNSLLGKRKKPSELLEKEQLNLQSPVSKGCKPSVSTFGGSKDEISLILPKGVKKREVKQAKKLDSGSDAKEFKEIIVDKSLEIIPNNFEQISIEEGLSVKTELQDFLSYSHIDGGINKLNLTENGLIQAVRIAHSTHMPLSISPDHIWALVMNGFSNHLKINHDKIRHLFVDFKGKKTLVVKGDSISEEGALKHSPKVFSQFSEQIAKYIGQENYQNLCPKFSTTDQIASAVHRIGLMNAMQHYFEFEYESMCGISKVKLLGELEDWETLKKHTQKLGQYGLQWWTKRLLEIMDQFINAYKGKKVVKNFWKYIYKRYKTGESGRSSKANGWIINFIPYVDGKKSEYADRSLEQTLEKTLKKWVEYKDAGLTTIQMSKNASGINETPITLTTNKGEEIPLVFVSGFLGSKVENDYITAVQFWAIAKTQKKEKYLHYSKLKKCEQGVGGYASIEVVLVIKNKEKNGVEVDLSECVDIYTVIYEVKELLLTHDYCFDGGKPWATEKEMEKSYFTQGEKTLKDTDTLKDLKYLVKEGEKSGINKWEIDPLIEFHRIVTD